MQVDRNYPVCSIPYINLVKEPHRQDENEKNKLNKGWQDGDGWYTESNKNPCLNSKTAEMKQFLEIFLKNSLKAEIYNGFKDFDDYSAINVLCFAASSHYVELIQHIIKTFGKQFLEVSVSGVTPLMYSIKYSLRKHEIVNATVEAMLNFGANPNMADKTSHETPLSYVAEYTNNYHLMLLLLKRGGIINPPPSKIAKERLNIVKRHIICENGKEFLFNALHNSESSLFQLPEDVIKYILFKRVDIEGLYEV